MKIVLVGPFPPYRGGISMFNHSLGLELAKNHVIHRVSFSLQYPKSLFPGKSQYFDFEGEPSEQLINSVNPVSWRKTARWINKIHPDVVVFQYWMPFFAPGFTSIAKQVKRKCGAKIIVNCNNITAHEPKMTDQLMTANFFRYCDGFMVMSDTVENDLKSIEPDPNYRKSPHPLYDVFGESIDQTAAKTTLGITEEKVILNFGLIRDYKGLDLLIRSAKILKSQLTNFKILVVGECYGDENKYIDLAEENNVMDVIDFLFDFVPNERVHEYFCAADVAVLPYKSATQSGVVPIAYHFDRPVVVSNVGGLPEIVEQGKSGFICEPNPEEIADGIKQYFNQSSNDFRSFVAKYKHRFSWSKYADTLLELVQS